jgi:hypothetical protein
MPEMDDQDGAYYPDTFAAVFPDLDTNLGPDDDAINVNTSFHPPYQADSQFETTTP